MVLLRLFRMHRERAHSWRVSLRLAWRKWRTPDLPLSPPMRKKP
jgi:hypothetical protein